MSETEKGRRYVTLNPGRVDHSHRHYYNLLSSMRICVRKLRETGVLLPFGHCLDRFDAVNL